MMTTTLWHKGQHDPTEQALAIPSHSSTSGTVFSQASSYSSASSQPKRMFPFPVCLIFFYMFALRTDTAAKSHSGSWVGTQADCRPVRIEGSTASPTPNINVNIEAGPQDISVKTTRLNKVQGPQDRSEFVHDGYAVFLSAERGKGAFVLDHSYELGPSRDATLALRFSSWIAVITRHRGDANYREL